MLRPAGARECQKWYRIPIERRWNPLSVNRCVCHSTDPEFTLWAPYMYALHSLPHAQRASNSRDGRDPAWPENMQLCTPAILYVINMYVFRTIVLAAVVGRPAYQFIDAMYVRD